ncbi:MAG: glycoside hydrolase [Methyloprofundus sp.]|nr:glycoside hydrolase [Methyloprofundus sp.]
MSENKKIKLVLCWHMHQPEYRDLQTGEFKLPWTYLHVIKDYVDMVAHLEEEPNAKAVINFAPILLEQIEDYAEQLNNYSHDKAPIKDSLLAALVSPDVPEDVEQRLELIGYCLRANREQQIERYPAFSKLAKIADWVQENGDAAKYLNDQYMVDILVWYHLAWMGETVKLTDARIQRLIVKGSNYTLYERMEIVDVISELLSKVLLRYKVLAQQGRIEISVTPYAHPIVPLLLDLNSTYEAMPDAPMPDLKSYPGGEERIKWHIKKGLEIFEEVFDFTPQGCWPSEGAVSAATLKLLAESGFSWAATGGQVLRNSLNISGTPDTSIHHPFKLQDIELPCFFRDDGLSDLIGFKYSTWQANDAIGELIHHIETIAASESSDSVVSIIMDGENAWDHYRANGYHFLSGLYKRLAEHEHIELTTFSECLAQKVEVKELPQLMAGSWVYGTFSTWIGDRDKNRGWDMLGEVKKCFDLVMASGRLTAEEVTAAEIQLAVCEGSDWFWWFGDYNAEQAVSSFEKQYRLNLANLYRTLGEAIPTYLSLSFTQGSGAPAMGGTMRKGTD